MEINFYFRHPKETVKTVHIYIFHAVNPRLKSGVSETATSFNRFSGFDNYRYLNIE